MLLLFPNAYVHIYYSIYQVERLWLSYSKLTGKTVTIIYYSHVSSFWSDWHSLGRQHLGAEVISKATSVKCLVVDACYELGSYWELSTRTPTHGFFMWLGLRHSMAAEFQGWMSHERERQMETVLQFWNSLRGHTPRSHFKMTF